MSKNAKSVEEMTLEEVQREIASIRERTCTDENCDDNHWPLATLDTVAALMPEGWIVSLNQWRRPVPWTALATSKEHNGICDVVKSSGDTELLARFRLLLLILRKESNV